MKAVPRGTPNLPLMRALLAALLLVCLVAPSLAQVSTHADRDARAYARYIESRYPVVDDPALVDRVGRIVERVRQAVGNTDYAWRFRIIANPVPNAFALPNGYIYIHQGLLDALPGATPISDDEIAFVLAHEMTHVILDHAGRTANASASLQRIVVRSGVIRSQAASVLSRFLRSGVEASFSREMETEADQWAVTWTALAGYNPEGALALFERMRQFEQANSVTLRIFHTHPSAADRAANVRKWIGTKPVPTGGTLDGAAVAHLPVTLVAIAPRPVLTAFDASQPAETLPASTGTQGEPVVPSPPTCPVLPVERLMPHLQTALEFTNLVTLRNTAADADGLKHAAEEKGAEAILLVALDGIDQESMPWPDGSVYSVCVRLTVLLIRTHDGAVLQRIPLTAARRATLSTRGGLTREEVFDEVLGRAMRPLEKPLAQALKSLRNPPPALAR